jgi:general secretion pathway protein D
MEQVNLEKSRYYVNAYNETRSRLLWMVDQKWERPVHRFQGGRTTAEAQARGGVRGTEATMAKLNRIIIPRIDLRDTTVREAVEFLKQRSRELDSSTENPQEKRGVNIFLKLRSAPSPDMTAAPPVEGAAALAPIGGTADTRITLSLTNVPLIEALRYLTELAGLKYKIEPYAVSIVPITEITTDLVTKKYRVPPGFIPASAAAGTEVTPSPGAPRAEVTETRIGSRTNALDYLQSQGVSFPSGAFAQYVPASSELIVRNTPDAIDLIDSLVDAAIGVQPTQVEIESKFLEITQNNIKELGFDWLIGPLAIGNTGAYASGGTQGFGSAPNPVDFPFALGGAPIGTNPVTGGLRSGNSGTANANGAISVNGIDALLGNLTGAKAPGIFGISGIFTNPQFQVVIRALNQKKGVDLMSAPKVTTKSGRKAIVRVAREFPYPTEFSPPEPPPPTTGGNGSVITPPNGTFVSQGVVTPSTPTAFETRNLGVTLEVEPIIGPDGYTIDLNLSPEVVEFDGFINYGSPINGPIINPLNPTVVATAVLTPNVINQPIFSTRKVTTSVSIWDGQTVALGGLVREDVQKVEDKVPILGDIPLAGRLFRSNVDQKIKRNLIIFVTARLMDAEGRPVRLDEDTEEIVEPLGLPQELPPPTFESPSFGK